MLFVIYINDLPDQVVSDLLLFADDTKMFQEVNTIEDALTIQSDIDLMDEWTHLWLLRFHSEKCKVLTLGKMENIKHAHRYQLGQNELEHIFVEKDLGVHVDSDLSFKDHIWKK